MPGFADIPGASRLAMGIEGDRIVFDRVNELRVRNYLDLQGRPHQDLWLKMGRDFDGIEFVHLKCTQVTESTLGVADRIPGLRLASLGADEVELVAEDPALFHVRCRSISFVD